MNTNTTPSTYDNAAVAAIAFALEHRDLDLLRLWNEGEFDQIRKEWPDAPAAMFVGADPLYRPAGEGEKGRHAAPSAGVVGELIEIGDDPEGQPRLVIHSTREQIRNGGLIPFQRVSVAAGSGQPGLDLAELRLVREKLANESASLPATSHVGAGIDKAVKALDGFLAKQAA